MDSDVNDGNSYNVYKPKPSVEWCGNILNMQAVSSGMVYLIIYRMHHQWRHLHMPNRHVIVIRGTISEGSNISYEIFYINLMCMIYFF